MLRFRALPAVVALLVAVGLAMPAQASDKTDKIRRLVVVMQVVDRFSQLSDMMMQSALENIRKKNPTVSDNTVAELAAAVNDEMRKSLPELIDQIVPIWDKNYSDDDVTAMLQFYESPAGQSIMGKQAKLIEDSKSVYKSWVPLFTQRIAGRIQAITKEKGLKL